PARAGLPDLHGLGRQSGRRRSDRRERQVGLNTATVPANPRHPTRAAARTGVCMAIVEAYALAKKGRVSKTDAGKRVPFRAKLRFSTRSKRSALWSRIVRRTGTAEGSSRPRVTKSFRETSGGMPGSG